MTVLRAVVMLVPHQVLLVSDPDTKTAAAAMDVHVGHFSDPGTVKSEIVKRLAPCEALYTCIALTRRPLVSRGSLVSPATIESVGHELRCVRPQCVGITQGRGGCNDQGWMAEGLGRSQAMSCSGAFVAFATMPDSRLPVSRRSRRSHGVSRPLASRGFPRHTQTH